MINRLFFAGIGLMFLLIVYNRVKSKRFSEKESIFWMITALLLLVLSIFPNIINYVTEWVNIVYPPSLLFLTAIMFLIIVVFRLTEHISKLQENLKELAQNFTILEERVRAAASESSTSMRN